MIKIIFSDFDDTLIHYYSDGSRKNKFSNYQIDILKKVKSKEIKFCIVTGRNLSFFYEFPRLLEVTDYILASNGSVIYDVSLKKFIYSNLISDDSLNELIQYSMKNNLSFILNSYDKRYKYGEYDNIICDNYLPIKCYKVEQVVVHLNNNMINSFQEKISSMSDIIINNVTKWGDSSSFDINSYLVSKGEAVKWLLNYLEISREDAIGFGDSVNDKSMLKVVGNSVAVGNANDDVKCICNDICLSCEDDGVFKYLDRLV